LTNHAEHYPTVSLMLKYADTSLAHVFWQGIWTIGM